MTKRITSEDCEGNIEDIEDGRYNTHVVPVSAEDDPGYEEIDYGDCTEFTVPLGRYGSHVVPIGGAGGGGGAACPDGGLKAGTTIDGDGCLSLNLKPGGAIILDGGQLAIDTTKLKVTTDQVYPSGTNTGIVLAGPDGENWDTQADYNQWLYNDQTRQDDKWEEDQEIQNEDIELRVLKTGDTMTGDLRVEADVHANRVDTRFVDSGEKSNLNLQWDGKTKVYVGGTEVTIQPPLQLNTEGRDANHAVTKGYIDALDAKQAAEINTIEYKLDALLGLTFQGTYEFKHNQSCEEAYQECMANCIGGDARCESDCLRDYSVCEGNNVDPGYFEAIDPDGRFDHLQEIVISKNDKSGVEVDWAGVLNAGDYLEVDHVFAGSLDKTNYGLYRITEEPVERTNSKGEKVYDLTLQFLQGDGVLNQRELYEIRGITAAEGVNPEELGDFLTKTDAAALYAPIGHNHNTTYATKTHSHSGTDITSGTISINRLPTGTTSSTVAKGNHTHSYGDVSAGSTNKYMTHKGEAGVCEFYISSGNLYWRT